MRHPSDVWCRAKLLHVAVKEVVAGYGGRLPKSIPELESLPGIGPYTARAIVAFAYNQNVILVETNIRTAIIHHFFHKNSSIYGTISDTQIQEVLKKLLPKGRAREWYNALMDYGAYLKRSGISHNTKSKKYVKQSKFSGSLREARGRILRKLATTRTASRARLSTLLGPTRRAQMHTALAALHAEGLICVKNNNYTLAR